MKIFFVLIILAQIIFLTSCQTINKKAQDALNKETKELSGYLNQPVSELKIFMGKPDKVIINDQGSELLIYISKKYKIPDNLQDIGKGIKFDRVILSNFRYFWKMLENLKFCKKKINLRKFTRIHP